MLVSGAIENVDFPLHVNVSFFIETFPPVVWYCVAIKIMISNWLSGSA